VPRFYVIDKDGNVLFQDYGWADDDDVLELIKMALKAA
jgi:hypothetical protein